MNALFIKCEHCRHHNAHKRHLDDGQVDEQFCGGGKVRALLLGVRFFRSLVEAEDEHGVCDDDKCKCRYEYDV